MAFNARNHDVREYRFQAYERRIFNRFDSEDECAAYLLFANEPQNANYLGSIRMHLWLGDGKYGNADPAHALDDNAREVRIENLRMQRENLVRLELSDRASTPEHGLLVHPEAEMAGKEGLEWVYAHTLFRQRRSSQQPAVRLRTVSLFVGQDNRGRMQDRLVVKTIERGDGTNPSSVQPDEPLPEIKNFVDDLANKHELQSQLESEYILTPRAWERCERSLPHNDANGNNLLDEEGAPLRVGYYGIRSYSDFCDGGDLGELAERHMGLPHGDPHRKIPEIFLVLILKAMSEALYKLQTGDEFEFYDEEDDPRIQRPNDPYDQHMNDVNEEWWGPVLHNDINPSNIFLKSDVNNRYPTIVLADLEGCLSVQTQPFLHRSTPGYRSPEFARYYRGTMPTIHAPIDVKSDMWCLGCVLWELMNMRLSFNYVFNVQETHERDMRNPDCDDEAIYPPYVSSLSIATRRYHAGYIADTIHWYSRKLNKIVDRCLQTSSIRRWNPRELREEVEEVLFDLSAIIDGDAETDGQEYDFGRVHTKPDPFRMGAIHEINRRREAKT